MNRKRTLFLNVTFYILEFEFINGHFIGKCNFSRISAFFIHFSNLHFIWYRFELFVVWCLCQLFIYWVFIPYIYLTCTCNNISNFKWCLCTWFILFIYFLGARSHNRWHPPNNPPGPMPPTDQPNTSPGPFTGPAILQGTTESPPKCDCCQIFAGRWKTTLISSWYHANCI